MHEDAERAHAHDGDDAATGERAEERRRQGEAALDDAELENVDGGLVGIDAAQNSSVFGSNGIF
jgi:hypothetical protein